MTSSIGTVIIAILELGYPLAVALVKEIVSIPVVFFILVFAWPKLVDKTNELQRLFLKAIQWRSLKEAELLSWS